MRVKLALRWINSRKVRIVFTTLTFCIIILLTTYNYAHLLLPLGFDDEEKSIKSTLSPLPEEMPQLRLYENKKMGNNILLTLIRNSEIDEIIETIRDFENSFNSKFHYDWWFLNDEAFTKEFQRRVRREVSGRTRFIKVPKELWSYPDYIDKDKAAACREEFSLTDVMYGDSESYRFMCRFNSGMFYKLPELQYIEYYWRIEPSTRFHCEITYDVFDYMRSHNKSYAFNMALQEDIRTIPTLWNATMEFLKENPQAVSQDNLAGFVSDDEGETYNLCHFWSNFEIANLKFLRSPIYQSYFEFLDRTGGFFYERWGDAPVHTLAASLMLPANQLHFVANTGYYHNPNSDCPRNDELRNALHCKCNPLKDFTWHKYSCIHKFFELQEMVRPDSLEHISMSYPTIYDTIIS